MILEIGTSDFRTLAGITDGVFVEPVKYYFDRLPKCKKENVAVSDKEGEIEVFYLTDKEIEMFNLPHWIRGCNSIGEIHQTVLSVLRGLDLSPDIVSRDVVKVVRIKSIIEKYNIIELKTLKIDTEGHDCIILNDFLDTVDFLPNEIIFEANILSNPIEVEKTVNRLTGLGYSCKLIKDNYICIL